MAELKKSVGYHYWTSPGHRVSWWRRWRASRKFDQFCRNFSSVSQCLKLISFRLEWIGPPGGELEVLTWDWDPRKKSAYFTYLDWRPGVNGDWRAVDKARLTYVLEE